MEQNKRNSEEKTIVGRPDLLHLLLWGLASQKMHREYLK